MTLYYFDDLIDERRQGWVYLVRAEGTDRYKIGRSTQPKERHQVLKRQSPYPLKVIYCFPSLDAATDEAKLHEWFASNRVYGEWFEFKSEKEIETFFSHHLERSWTNIQVAKKLLELIVFHKVQINEEQLYYLQHFIQMALDKDPLAFCYAVNSFEFDLTTIPNDEIFNKTSFVIGFFVGVRAGLSGFTEARGDNS